MESTFIGAKMKRRLIGLFVSTSTAFTLCAILLITYWLWFDYRIPPVDIIKSHPTTVTKDSSIDGITEVASVKPGAWFYTYRNYCVRYDFRAEIGLRRLVSKTNPTLVYYLPLMPPRIVKEGCVARAYASQVPDDVPPGEYWYESDSAYRLPGNPFAHEQWVWPVVSVVVK